MPIEVKLYLLELTEKKYYVGQSDDPEFRFVEHLGSRGSKWTRRYKPVRIAKIQTLLVESVKEAMLYENWMTLQAMERFGWEHVRGGDYLVLENYLLKERLEHIYDFEQNKIKYYVTDLKRYLFGACQNWLVYVLELHHQCFYIGSSQHLGKSLGEHFSGKGIAWTRDHPVVRVAEVVVVKADGNYVEVKNRLLRDYISRYGWENVLGGQMPKRNRCSPF